MNNVKGVIFFSFMFLLLVLLFIFTLQTGTVTDIEKIDKANELYGTEYCTCTGSEIGATAIETVTCPLCGTKHTNAMLGQSRICDECLNLTNRCGICSKIKKE